MNKQNFTNEINKTLNSKIYYKPEENIETIDLTKFYKIKKNYLDMDLNMGLKDVFTDTVVPPLLCKEVINYLDNNYHEPDSIIFAEIVILILSAMPDLDEKNYIKNIKNYIST